MSELGAGDFKNVYDSMYDTLCLFAQRFTCDYTVAEDIVQEAFIALWDARAAVASLPHARSFLYRVCRNRALDWLRHEKIKNDFLDKSVAMLEDEEQFTRFVIEEEVGRILALTQAQLPEQCRLIFTLAVLRGMGNAEIAERLGISVNTVKTQKKIAYRRLREHLMSLTLLLGMLR